MKILVIHNYYQYPGGERTAIKAHIDLLKNRGQQVITYFADNSKIKNYNLFEKAKSIPNALYSIKTHNEINKLVRTQKPDLAHVHNVFPLISPSIYRVLKDNNIPIIQSVHNFRFLCPNGLFYTKGQICERCKYGNTIHAVRYKCYRNNYLLSTIYGLTIGLHRRKKSFQSIDRFITPTEFTAHKLVESKLTSWQKISILGNFLQDPLPIPGSFDQKELFLSYLGRLSPEKGVNILLEALVGIPGVGLKLMGDGPLFDQLKETTRKLGIENRVRFLGHTIGEPKWSIIRKSIAVVVPSVSYESFGLVILESLATGTPVIASDLGSLSHLVEDEKNGLLFRPGDSQDLQNKILWVLNNPNNAQTMGSHGRHIVEESYSAD
ncbi:MAG: glycosyltransferase family 4 protein, partial [Anaerolineales bacterium]